MIVRVTLFLHNLHCYRVTCVTQSWISCAHNTISSNVALLIYQKLLVVGPVDWLVPSWAIIARLAAVVLSWLEVGRLLGLIFCVNKLIENGCSFEVDFCLLFFFFLFQLRGICAAGNPWLNSCRKPFFQHHDFSCISIALSSQVGNLRFKRL